MVEPRNQGFDYAYYGLFNGAPDLWPESHPEEPSGRRGFFLDFPGLAAGLRYRHVLKRTTSNMA